MAKQYYPKQNAPHTQNNGHAQGHNNKPKKDADVELNPYEGYSHCGNLGMLYTRCYYGEITREVLDKKPIKIMERTKPKSTNHQSLYYASRNDNLIQQAKKIQSPDPMPNADKNPVSLQTLYPGLLIGVGIPHAAKQEGAAQLGLLFDHSTGLPYIPGSSVKGVLRSMFPLQDIALAEKKEKKAGELEKKNEFGDAKKLKDKAMLLRIQADEKRKYIAEIVRKKVPSFTPEMVDDLERSIFVGQEYDEKKKDYVQVAKRDIFFDAFPAECKNGLLDTDFITPHTEGELLNPIPIQFMRINPGVTFRFDFRLRDSKLKGGIFVNAKTKRAFFQEILTTVGIGAKTNVGYGQFTEIKSK